MDQNAWDALVAHYNRVSKNLDPQKAGRGFKQNVESVLDRMPREEVELLKSHWATVKSTVHPLAKTRHPAPLFLVLTDIRISEMTERITGMATSDGCCFGFESRLVYTAPGEVVQGVIAHELAHGWIHAKYHVKNLALPLLKSPETEQARHFDSYLESRRHEEALVHETTSRWGFPQHFLELWGLAIEDAPTDPSKHYAMLKRMAKSHPQQMGLPA